MIAIPVVELLDGAVQFVNRLPAPEGADRDRPGDVIRAWEHYGFRRVHLHDASAAAGRGSNWPVLRDVLFGSSVALQVAGGVSSGALVADLLDAGAAHLVVDARAIEEPAWIATLASRHPGEIIVACEVRERRVSTRGWMHNLPVDLLDIVEDLNGIPLGGLLITAVHQQDQRLGTDLPLLEDVVERSNVPVFASGDIDTMQHLRALEHRGLAGAVVVMSLYDGVLDPTTVAGEFSE